MFEKEEKRLEGWKENYNQVDVPLDKIDQAINLGFNKGTTEEKIIRHKKIAWIWSSLVAAILFVSLLTSIRVSPGFANYISAVPGMEKIVELIRYDKGLLAAVENDYVQEIGVSQEKNGMKVTIESVIADEQGMVIFYSIKTKKEQKGLEVEKVILQSKDGDELPVGTISYGSIADEHTKNYTDTIEYFFSEPLEHQDLKLDVKVKSQELSESFSLPFSIKKQDKTTQIYGVNETVTVEGQKIKVKKVTIYPLRVAIHVEMDQSNMKKILEFEDIRLVDQSGEVWSKISNGVTSSNISESERIIYLQSNYFKDPKELYIVMNKIQAVDKDEAFILVDTEKQEILKQPSGNRLHRVQVKGDYLEFVLEQETEFNYVMSGSTIKDAKGKEFDIGSSYTRESENQKTVGLALPSETYTNPIKIELDFFPSWIEGKAKIKVR